MYLAEDISYSVAANTENSLLKDFGNNDEPTVIKPAIV